MNEILTRFKEYWKQVDRGRLSYDDLMNRYPTSLIPTENQKHTFDTSEYERRIRVLVSCAKRQSDRSMINILLSSMV